MDGLYTPPINNGKPHGHDREALSQPHGRFIPDAPMAYTPCVSERNQGKGIMRDAIERLRLESKIALVIFVVLAALAAFMNSLRPAPERFYPPQPDAPPATEEAL